MRHATWLIVLLAITAMLVATSAATAAVPQYAKTYRVSPKLIKMLPHIKEHGNIVGKPHIKE